MQFSQPQLLVFFDPLFFVFFLVVFGVHWSLPWHAARKTWLLICSYLFYASWDYRFLSLILISTAVDYVAGLAIQRSPSKATRRAWLTASMVTNLGILGFFKYYNFFVDSAVELLNRFGLQASTSTLNIVLPVGISFYTFQTMSYTFDVFARRLAPTRRLLDFALFVAFFPQLVAGPIVRARDFLPQLQAPRRMAQVNARACIALFLIGFIKKRCIADHLAGFIDPVFAAPQHYGTWDMWQVVMMYATQIYCDFSGYSDMAIGCGGLLGYQLPRNFDLPYSAANITDFWRRWHISLSTWLRDYLYIALGGNRGGTWFVSRNVMITMLLGGLWHGAGWNFVIWGGFHGLALIIHRNWLTRVPTAKWFKGFAPAAGWAATLYFVCLLWIFFRATELTSALTICRGFVLLQGGSGRMVLPAGLGLAVLLVLGLHFAARRVTLIDHVQRLPYWAFWAAAGLAAGLAIAFAAVDIEPFIYFQF